MTQPESGAHPVAALADPEAIGDALRRFTPYVSTLALVLDDSPSMDVWAPTVSAFQSLASSVFGAVHTHRLGRFREAAAQARTPGGDLIMVISDGLASFWAQSSADQVLHTWGRTVPVAIVNPYPQEHWYRSLLSPRKIQLSAPRVMSPNAELLIREPTEWMNLFDDPVREAAVAVPMLELGTRWLTWWASLVGGSAPGWLDAVAHIADPDRPPGPGGLPDPEPAPAETSARRLVQEFRNESSAPAFRLATLVASTPPRPDLEVLRIVQGVLLPSSRPLHLAEVVTSPLLVTGTGGRSILRPGVREELLGYAAREDTVRVIEVVSAYFGDRFPAARSLLHVLRAPDEQPETALSATNVESAQFELTVLRALSGPYASRADRLATILGRVEARQTSPATAAPPPPSLQAAPHHLVGHGTSQADRRWNEVSETLEIDVFRRDESVALLRKRNPGLDHEDADRLATILDDLPLAIAQAAAWGATTQMDVDEYIQRLTAKRAELAGREKDPHFEIAVATAWAVALEQLGTANPGALQLLQVCSFMAPEPISQEIFLAARNVGFSAEMNAMLQNPNLLNRAIRVIEQYGLARIDYREQTFTVQLHRLVRKVVVDQLSAEDRASMQHAAHLLLAGGNPGDPSKIAQWPRYHALLPHVQASDQVGCEDAWARQLVLDTVDFLYSWGDNEACRVLAAQAVESWTAMLGPDDPQVLKAVRRLAFVLQALGNFAEAARLNADCLERLQAINGPDDEETLDAMSLVAADRRAAGDFAGALRLDQDAYEISVRVFGRNVPHTLAMAHSLGVSLRLIGDFPSAMALDMETVRRRIEVLGSQHYLTLLTQNGLILDLRERGEYLGANKRHEQLYERIQRILGSTHPQTLMAARSLAVSRRRAGEHARARKLALATVNELRRRFGELHPEAIACGLNYAVDLRENDELVESRELAEQTWHDYLTALGPEHPYTLGARTNLGIVLRLLGELDLAAEHDEAAHHGLRERLGVQHVLTLTCATNFASDLAARGEHQRAYEMDAETLRRSRDVLGSEHASTLACALNLSFDLRALGRNGESDRLFDEVIDAYRRTLGPEHPAIVAARAGMRANCDVDPMPL